MLEDSLGRPLVKRGEAEEVFASWLEAKQADDAAEFADLCRDYPKIREELKTLHGAFQLGQGVAASRSFYTAMQGQWGAVGKIRLTLGTMEPQTAEMIQPAGAPGSGETGKTSSRYVSEGVLARGGMGVIYAVQDRDLNRRIAMKVMGSPPQSASGKPDQAMDSQWLARFLAEAQVTAQLDHPGIVPVHEVGIDEQGQLYFTMKLVRGRDLAEIVRLAQDGREGWSLPRMVSVLVRACQAVAFAHVKGIIHRDLKPANIMVGDFGEVYVMDWGLAKERGRTDLHDLQLRWHLSAEWSDSQKTRPVTRGELTGSPKITMNGAVVGTPAYMSPEQALGEVETLDERSDIYSLGAILYRLLTGRAPYSEEDSPGGAHRILLRLQEGPPRPVHELARSAPPELVAICGKAMARDKARRYVSCQALAEDLQAWLDRRVVQAYKTGPLTRLHYWMARNKTAAFASAATLALLFSGSIAVIFLQGQAHHDFTRRYYASQIAEASMALRSGKHERAEALLKTCPPQFRGWEWAYLTQNAQSWDDSVFLNSSTPILDVAVDPQGRWLAVARSGNPVEIRDVSDSRNVRSLGEAEALRLAWDPQGEVLAVADALGGIQLWQTETGMIQTSYKQPSRIEALVFSPDGNWLAASGETNGWIRLWPVKHDAKPIILSGHAESVLGLAFSADGRFLVSGSRDKTIKIWNLETGQEQQTLTGHDGLVRSVTFNPDASRVVSASYFLQRIGGEIKLWDLDTRWFRDLNLGEAGQGVFKVLYNPDGTQIVTCDWDGRVRFWNSRTGLSLGHLDAHQAGQPGIAFLPRDQRLATWSADGVIRFWQRRPSSVLECAVDDGQLRNAAFHPQGRWLASASLVGGVHFLDPETGRKLRTFDPGVGATIALALSRDGSAMASAHWKMPLLVWDPETLQIRWQADPDQAEIWCLQFSPDDRTIVAGNIRGAVQLWDANTGRLGAEHKSAHDQEVEGVAFSPDGTRIASCDNSGQVRLWQVRPWQLIWEVATAVPHRSIVFSQDGRRLIHGSKDGTAQVREAGTGRLLLSLRGHEQGVQAVALSRDGTRIFTGSSDGTMKVWDAVNGQELVTLFAAGNTTIWDIATSADGRQVAASDGRGIVTLWTTGLDGAR